MALRPWVLDLLSLGVALALSMAVALLYVRLRRELPDTRPFAQALAVAGVVSAIIVLSIGDSIARGIGLVGALTVVRFRSDLKDPRDLIFAFAALATGVAAGAHAWAVAVFGTAIFSCAFTLVSMSWFAKGDTFDAMMSIRTKMGNGQADIHDAIRSFCRSAALVRVRQAGADTQEQAYEVRLKNDIDRATFVNAIKQVTGVEDALLVELDGARRF